MKKKNKVKLWICEQIVSKQIREIEHLWVKVNWWGLRTMITIFLFNILLFALNIMLLQDFQWLFTSFHKLDLSSAKNWCEKSRKGNSEARSRDYNLLRMFTLMLRTGKRYNQMLSECQNRTQGILYCFVTKRKDHKGIQLLLEKRSMSGHWNKRVRSNGTQMKTQVHIR